MAPRITTQEGFEALGNARDVAKAIKAGRVDPDVALELETARAGANRKTVVDAINAVSDTPTPAARTRRGDVVRDADLSVEERRLRREEQMRPVDAEPLPRRTIATAPPPADSTTFDGDAVGRDRHATIDPRLEEARDALRKVEADVTAAEPVHATVDPRLVEIRDATRKREEELAGRSIATAPARR